LTHSILCSARLKKALLTAETTRLIHIDSGILSSIASFYNACFGDVPAMIIADVHTWAAAGQAVSSYLQQGHRVVLEPLIFDQADFYAHSEHVDRVQNFLDHTQAIPIAVGSGTLNDIVKLAAFRCQRPYMIVATAASMDGYTAFGASITDEGFKQTFFCPAPKAVLVDLDILAAAPAAMNAAGYADLMAKIPAGADWLLADALALDALDVDAWQMVQEPLRSWLADPQAIRQRDLRALTHLIEGLLMSGLAMQKTKSSRTASGAEHQFSHLWDNQHLRHNGAIPFHGFKVAIGSLAITALYHRLLAWSGMDQPIDLATVKAYWPSWQEIEKTIEQEFPEKKIAELVWQESRAKYLPAVEICERMTRLQLLWPELRSRLQRQLLTPEQMQHQLRQAGAPIRPEDIGLTTERLCQSYQLAQLIRRRYSVLDLVQESGQWPLLVDSLFAQKGFWQGL